jgi:hypothetical protein
MGKQGVWVVIFRLNEDGEEDILFQFTSSTFFFYLLQPDYSIMSCQLNNATNKDKRCAPVKTTAIPPLKGIVI